MASQQYYNQLRKNSICDKLGITSGQYSYIKRIGTILNCLYTNECNGFYNEYTGKEDTKQAQYNDKQITKYEAIATKFAKDNKLELHLQTDPRGSTIYLDTKPIAENDYTKALCI